MATPQGKKGKTRQPRRVVVQAAPAPVLARPPIRPPKFEADWAKSAKLVRFVLHLACHGNVSRAINQAKIDRTYVYDKRNSDREFASAWDEAKKQGLEVLKDEAWRRAHDGVTEPHFHQGELVGYVRKASDTLLMFLIKQADPSYREHFDMTLANAGGRPFLFQMALHPEALKQAQAGK